MSRLISEQESVISGEQEELYELLDNGDDEPFEARKDLLRRPAIGKAAAELYHAVMKSGTVAADLKWMVGHVSSFNRGCMFCSAHTASYASDAGAPIEKVEALWDFERSPLFSDAERAAFRFAMAASSIPNAVGEQHFVEMRPFFSEGEIIEILSTIAFYAFFNCWNDSLATELEPRPRAFAEKYLTEAGWKLPPNYSTKDPRRPIP